MDDTTAAEAMQLTAVPPHANAFRSPGGTNGTLYNALVAAYCGVGTAAAAVGPGTRGGIVRVHSAIRGKSVSCMALAACITTQTATEAAPAVILMVASDAAWTADMFSSGPGGSHSDIAPRITDISTPEPGGGVGAAVSGRDCWLVKYASDGGVGLRGRRRCYVLDERALLRPLAPRLCRDLNDGTVGAAIVDCCGAPAVEWARSVCRRVVVLTCAE